MTAIVNDMPDRDELWALHDHPDRQLDEYALIFACNMCRGALVERGQHEPRSLIAVKTESDRLLVTADLLAEVLEGDAKISALVYIQGDRVRELYVPTSGWLPPRQRWRSSRCEEDDRAAGRTPRRYRVARRESAAARARRASEWEAPKPPAEPLKMVALGTSTRAAREKYRSLVAAAAEFGLRAGRPLDRDLIALLLAATELGHRDDISPTRWSRTGVNELLSIHVFNWCSLHTAKVPDRLPEALWTYLDFLFAAGRIHPLSEPLLELRKPLRCYCGLDENGQRDPGAERVPCECYVEYRGPTAGSVRRPAC